MSNAASSKASLTDAPAPEIAFIHGKVSRLLQALDRSFVERETHIRVAMLAILSGHHVLLLGPPGTAKSLLARALCASLHDATFFEYLLSKFTHPDELFGPVSIPGLKEEDYRRLTDGYLPRAHRLPRRDLQGQQRHPEQPAHPHQRANLPPRQAPRRGPAHRHRRRQQRGLGPRGRTRRAL